MTMLVLCTSDLHNKLFLLVYTGYLMQYAPSLGMAVMKKIGPGRAAQMKGGGGYDVKAMLFNKKSKDT